ncbi:MAG: DUF5711 family protein [Oscillospiraceae bacterium]|jgi:hypothetical protein|nr:DUF5711 family protein [Oscillospiraceae bacterium]
MSTQPAKNTKTKRMRALLLAAGALLFCALAVLTVLSGPNGGLAALFAHSSSEGYPYSPEEQSVMMMLPAEDGVEILSPDGVTQLGKKARELYSRKLDYADPIAVAGFGRTLVANRADGRYFMHGKDGVIFEGNAHSPITLAVVGKKNSAIVSQTAAGQTQLDVLNTRGESVFSWSNAGERIVSAALSQNGRCAAAALLRMDEGERYSRVLLFDVKKSQIIGEVDFGQSTLLRVCFTKENNVYVLGETILAALKTDGSRIVSDTEFIAGQLERFAFSPEGRAALVLRGEGNESALRLLDGKGALAYEKSMDGTVAALALDGKNLAVLQNDGLLELLDKKGNIAGTADTGSDPVSDIVLDGKTVYARTNKSIERFTFR